MKRTVSSKVTVCGVKMSEHVVYLAQESCLFQRFRLESVSGQVSAKRRKRLLHTVLHRIKVILGRLGVQCVLASQVFHDMI